MIAPKLWFFVLVTAGVQSAPSRSNPWNQPITFKGKEIKNLLAFGDSYTYVQGTQGHWNYSFISDAFNYTFAPEQLLSSEIVKNTTSSGGPNWVEYLTGCYEGLPDNCPETKLWDFAFADLDDQVKQWDLYARETLDLEPADTLVAFWIGSVCTPLPLNRIDRLMQRQRSINDINDSAKFTNVSFPAWYETLVKKWFDSVVRSPPWPKKTGTISEG
ncbi:hypothetical protein SLS55_010023 [Diplodia seriata]|uniref:Uncharacterized protein n=1 Tax=Diplodia seriata TaxID=420778 RepID=A0ABR3C1N9_9PEZI